MSETSPLVRMSWKRCRRRAALVVAVLCGWGLSALGPNARAAEEAGHGNATAATGRPPLKIPDEYKTGGFAIGCQAYTFNHFTVFEAIEKTHEAGGKVIEFYPGQRLRKDQPAVAFGHTSPEAVIQQVKDKLKEHHILAVNYGVVSAGDRDAAKRKEEWRQIFEFAKKMGLPAITSEPNVDDMDTIESLVKEFNVRFCIHDHPKRPNDPNYKFWDPHYVLSLVKDRDPRMGACADTGHWVRSGVKPVDALKVLEGRVLSSHLKDLNEFGRESAHDMPYGEGVSDVKAILDELKRQGFDGNISIEYEYNWDNSVPDVKKCIEYVRQYGQQSGHEPGRRGESPAGGESRTK